MTKDLISILCEGSMKATALILKNPGNLENEVNKINNMNEDKYQKLSDTLKIVMKKRIEIFLDEMKPVSEMVPFNNELAKQMINAECNLVAIETIKRVGA